MKINPKDEIKSPCIKICKIDEESKLCLGCFRTIDEISSWIFIDENEKKNILKRVEERKKNFKNE